jgi:ADP-heptose:LPS heptosyltransferase
MPDRAAVKKLLYVRLDGIGDGVLAGELLEKLPEVYPNAAITVACDTATAPLYASAPAVKQTITLDKRRLELEPAYLQMAAKLLRACRADIIFNSTISPSASVCALLVTAGAPLVSTGMDATNALPDARDIFNGQVDEFIPLRPGIRMDIERTRDILEYFGFQEVVVPPRFWLSPEDALAAAAKLESAGLKDQPFVALFATGNVPYNTYGQWGKALADVCAKRGLPVVILGGESKAGLTAAHAIQDYLAKRNVSCHTFCGELSLGVSAGIIQRSRLAAGADTGLAHIACAFDVPLVVLVGGGTFGRFFPYSRICTAVCLPLECYSCNWSCRYERAHCIAGIAPETVRQALEYTLDQEKGKERRTLFMQRPTAWRPGPDMPAWRSPAEFISAYKSKEPNGLAVMLGR